MSDYVNANTNFNDVTIKNDNPCLTGIWYLKYDLNSGNTYYYPSGSTTPFAVDGVPYTGPVNFVGRSIIFIQQGAQADGLVVVPNSTGSPTINNYGTLTNSTIFDATVNNGLTTGFVSSTMTAISTGNSYVSSTVNMRYGVVSTSDSFYNISATTSTSGTLDLSQLSSVSSASTSFQTSNGTGKMVTGTGSTTAYAEKITISNPTVVADSGTVSSSCLLSNGGSFGNVAANKGFSGRIINSYQTFVGMPKSGTVSASYVNWTAYLGDDGVTTYYKTTDASGATVVTTGPLNLLNVTSLTILAGATVENCFIAQTAGHNTSAPVDAPPTLITIQQGGILKNSQIYRATIVNNGTSYNNTYLQGNYVGESGSISDFDGMYQYVGNYVGSLKIPKPTNSPSWDVIAMSLGTNPSDSTITLKNGSVFNSYAEITTLVSNMYPESSITIEQSGNVSVTSNDAVTCFLTGTLIQTVNGLIAVENLSIGDQIITYQNNQQGVQPIIWVGYNDVKVKTYLPEDEAGYPVRIVKNAISDGVPASDLLVTPEHSIFFNGALIPARMLVNNLSIFYDHRITEYTYYHFELEEHSIVSADNVLTESYLDTGNRSSFISNQNIVSIVNKKKEWNVDAGAPLVTNRDVVEPVFKQLIARAVQLGFDNITQDVLTTDDSGLYLLTESGVILEATHQSNGRFIFKLPENTTEVSLISQISKPSRVIGPFVDDRRDLGVLVGEVTLLEKNNQYSITEHFTSAKLSGWDVQEQAACRWTNGNAKLTVRATPSQNVGVLVIQVLDTPLYQLENKQKVA